MDQFEERLARLAELSDEELSALEVELTAAFDAADQGGDIDTMSSLADAIDSVRSESERRKSTPVETATPAPGADASMAASAEAPPIDSTDENASETVAAETEAETVAEEQTPEGTEPETPPETEAEATEEAAPAEGAEEVVAEAEAIAAEAADTPAAPEETEVVEAEASTDEATPETVEASTATDATEDNEMSTEAVELTGDDVPAETTPEEALPQVAIRAGADIQGVVAGSDLPDMDAVAEALTSKINAMRHMTGGNGEQIIVASIQSLVEDDERTLHRGDAESNLQKIRKLVGNPEAMTAAANGWCAPRTPRYEVYGVGTTDRPVRDSLSSMSADRGGIVYSTPPTLSDADDAVGSFWWSGSAWASSASAAQSSPGTAKVKFTAACTAELTADLEAVTVQLQFTNMMARAYPEYVRRNMELALVGQARFAESRNLAQMYAAATGISAGDPTPEVGAARDYLYALRVLRASTVNRFRIGLNDRVDLWAPAWLRDMMAADLSYQMPGDDTISVALSEIDGYISALNVDVTWYLDDIPGQNQLFSKKGDFPTNAVSIMAPKGTFLHLDGGTLDLGVVRDSALVSTNEYIEFSETFEAVAKVGIEALRWSYSPLVVGGTALGVNTSAGVELASAS